MAAADELVLLERVFLRIGSAETDEQLQAALAKFLPPVLLKLASQADGVRKKVMELLVHINKRVKSRPKIQLPVRALMTQYQDPEASPFVTNFTILYIKIGYPRLESSEQADLLPSLIQSIEKRPVPQQDSLMQLIMPALQYVKLPADPARCKALFGLEDKPEIARLILDYIIDMLLVPYSVPSGSQEKPPTGGASNRPSAAGGSTPPPGLSEAAYKRVTGDGAHTPEEVEKIKLGLLNILGGGVFPDEQVVCHMVVALADARHAVATAADRSIKKVIGSQDWNSPAIISKLYSIFQGTVVVKGQTSVVKPDQKRTPASIQLRMKIFPYFLKSKEAANQFPSCVQVVFDCLYGTNTTPKLKLMAVQFVHHLCLNCSDAKFNPIGAVLLSGMVKLIGESNKEQDPQLRSLAYVAVGKIARRVPQLVTKDIALLQTFFDAMCKESPDRRLAVQEALSMMSPAFRNLDTSNLRLMEALLMQNIEKADANSRQMAVQYAIAVFPSNHIPSRYILLLACGDTKEEVYAEASKALRKIDEPQQTPAVGEDQEMVVDRKSMPAFSEMVNYINEKANQRLKTSNKYVIGNNVLAFNPATYVEILMYLRMCLAYNSGVKPNLESTATMQREAPSVGILVNQLLEEQPGDKGVMAVYISVIRKLLTAIGGAPAMYCLLEIVGVAREKVAPQFVKHLDWVKNFMFSSREDMREYACQLYALVVAAETHKQQIVIIRDLTKNLDTQAIEGQHGSMLALGYLLGHLLSVRRQQVGDVQVEDMDVDTAEDKQLEEVASKAVKKIATMLSDSHILLQGAACTALGEIGRRGAVPLPDTADKKATSKLSVVKAMVDKVQSTKENPKVREKAALSLGLLCVGQENFPHRKQVIDGLLDCAQPKQIELHFTVGESLVCAALGPASACGRDVWKVKEEDYKCDMKEDTLKVESILKKLMEKYLVSSNPHVRQAACIWLMELVKGCKRYSIIQSQLKEIQLAFMSLLSDHDETTQDLASKGVGIVYEISGPEQKESLVSLLVDTLMTGKKSKQATGQSQVFHEGSIDGKSLNTYKELCSIANDLHQPDLIYKFMQMASHNAMWNSKKGAAFGFSTIAAQAGEQLSPYLHQIVPKLYRYQFDPNPRINQAMTSIWNSLVSDSKKTVDKYLKEILDDLMTNLTSSQWRVRESSCLAVNDLLRGRALDDVIDGLPELWETLFRVRDDIKESVRNAADLALKTMSRVCIKICDLNYGSVGERAISLVLPCLVKVGLTSQLQEVRALSLATILKISKNAGNLLKPHVPLLVVALLESLSGLEPQYLNYVSLHAASTGQDMQEKLDSARLAASKTSPMMQTINQCVQYVDENNMSELIPRLTDLIRSGIGLGTKAGCANFIGSLIHQCPRDLAPYSGKLLGALLNGLNDRNTTVKKSYATAIGNLVKIAKDSSVEKLIKRLKEWYLEKEDDSIRHACGLTLNAISQKSSDTLKRHATVALPLAFLAMHAAKNPDGSSDAITTWEEVWFEGTPGTESGIRLYMKELIEISQTALDSQSWPMKAQGAATMNKMADKLGSNLGSPHLGMVLNALLAGLQGRTWTGKEALLQAISSVCVSCKDAMDDDHPVDGQPTVTEVLDAVLRECRKENIPYKQEALSCIGAILEAQKVDRYQEISNIITPLIDRKIDAIEDLDVNTSKWLDFQATAYDCIGQAWPLEKNTQENHQVAVCKLLGSSLNQSVWRVGLAILRALNKIFTRLHILQDTSNIEANKETVSIIVQHVLPPLCTALGNVKYGAIRAEALGVTEIVLGKLAVSSHLELVNHKDLDQVQQSLRTMATDNQPELQDKSADILKLLGTN